MIEADKQLEQMDQELIDNEEREVELTDPFMGDQEEEAKPLLE